jgi:hypothetical protein
MTSIFYKLTFMTLSKEPASLPGVGRLAGRLPACEPGQCLLADVSPHHMRPVELHIVQLTLQATANANDKQQLGILWCKAPLLNAVEAPG